MRYMTINNRIQFPASLLSAAARAASTDAAYEFFQAERDLAAGLRPVREVHASVMQASSLARSLERASER